MSVPFAPEDLSERFRVMKRQNATAYKVDDYLNPSYKVPADDRSPMCVASSDQSSAASSSTSTGTNSSSAGVNKDWRSKICECSNQVINHF